MEDKLTPNKVEQEQHVKEITSGNWEVEVEKSNLLVFVDFWARGVIHAKKLLQL